MCKCTDRAVKNKICFHNQVNQLNTYLLFGYVGIDLYSHIAKK